MVTICRQIQRPNQTDLKAPSDWKPNIWLSFFLIFIYFPAPNVCPSNICCSVQSSFLFQFSAAGGTRHAAEAWMDGAWSSLVEGGEGACFCPSGKLLFLWKYKTIETVHQGQYPNLFDNWADTSLHLLLWGLSEFWRECENRSCKQRSGPPSSIRSFIVYTTNIIQEQCD